MPDQTDLKNALLYCDQFAHRKARHFYPAFRFLPRNRRIGLSVFYTFCALSDDIADDTKELDFAEKYRRLADWRRHLDDCFAGNAVEPVFTALQDTITRFHLPAEPFYDLLDGIEMDLQPRRYATFNDLQEYCRRVASSVGLISVRIFGCDHPGADRYADALGIAFQLTNILRDIEEDLKRDRVYLPREDLKAFSYSEEDLNRRIYDERFLRLMEFQYQRALDFYRRATPRLAGDQARRLHTAELMKSVYLNLLKELHRHRFRVFDRRISLPTHRLVSGIAFAFVRSLFR